MEDEIMNMAEKAVQAVRKNIAARRRRDKLKNVAKVAAVTAALVGAAAATTAIVRNRKGVKASLKSAARTVERKRAQVTRAVRSTSKAKTRSKSR